MTSFGDPAVKAVFGASAREMVFEGDRAIVLSVTAKAPERALKHCVAMALTYHAG